MQLQHRSGETLSEQPTVTAPSALGIAGESTDPAQDPVELAAPDPSNIPIVQPVPPDEPKNLPNRPKHVSEEVNKEADTHVVEFLDTYAAVLAAPENAVDSISTDLSGLLQGSALGEVQASIAEYASNGWVLSGTPSVVASTISDLDLEAEPTSMTVYACVDSSEVKVSTTAGTPVPSNMGKAMNIIYLEQAKDESWKIVRTAFPDDPTC
ncbi:hypothetical protein ACIGB6_14585 [Paeniglutamicibacter gangotriensis]|uniref:hypothetical protein n=1 Tax=Paeniglutamicibacter gangotriensis TaxID=254787 RepID=UPI0037C6BF84